MGKLLSAATDGDVKDDKRCSLFTKHELDEEKHISEKKMERNEHRHEASVKPTAAGGEEQKAPDPKLLPTTPNLNSSV